MRSFIKKYFNEVIFALVILVCLVEIIGIFAYVGYCALHLHLAHDIYFDVCVFAVDVVCVNIFWVIHEGFKIA